MLFAAGIFHWFEWDQTRVQIIHPPAPKFIWYAIYIELLGEFVRGHLDKSATGIPPVQMSHRNTDKECKGEERRHERLQYLAITYFLTPSMTSASGLHTLGPSNQKKTPQKQNKTKLWIIQHITQPKKLFVATCYYWLLGQLLHIWGCVGEQW